MVRLRFDIIGISEMRWSGNLQRIIDNHKVYHCGDENSRHIHVVDLIVSCRLQEHVINFKPVPDRIMVTQLINGNPGNINKAQVYAPITNAEDLEI